MYGGKIDDEHDFALLARLVSLFLVEDAFDEDFDILARMRDLAGEDEADEDTKGKTLMLPSGTGKEVFERWVVEELPEREPPGYLGLPGNAEKLLLVGQGAEMVRQVRVVMGVLDEGEVEI